MAMAIGILAVASSVSAAPVVGELTEYTAPGLTLFHHGADARVRHIERQIPQLEKILDLMLGFKPTASTPMRVFLVDSHLWRYYLQRSEGSVTDFIPHRFANYVVLTEGRRQDFAGEFYFAYTKGWLANHVRGAYPLWFETGIAALMGNAAFHNDTARFEQLLPTPFSLWFPTAEMLRIERNSREHLSTTTANAYQWQAWVMMHLAVCHDARFADQVALYMRAVNNLENVEAAAVKSFGISLDELDARLRKHATLNSFPLPKVKLGEVAPLKFSAGRELSRAQAIEAVANLMFAGRKPASQLRQMVEGHEELDGGPRSRVLRLRLAIVEKQPPLIEAALAALEPHHASPDIARDTGVALHEHLAAAKADGIADARLAPLRDRAFELLNRALEANALDPEAAWSYAMLAVELQRDLPRALERLERAEASAPGNFHLAEATALIHRASGNRAALGSAIEKAAQRARTLEQRAWVAKVFNEWKSAPPPKAEPRAG
jgi:hypothetical protein